MSFFSGSDVFGDSPTVLSRFDIEFGLGVAPLNAGRAARAVGKTCMDESLQGVTALLVDDDSDALESTALLLSLAGADVSVTSSVEDAVPIEKSI